MSQTDGLLSSVYCPWQFSRVSGPDPFLTGDASNRTWDLCKQNRVISSQKETSKVMKVNNKRAQILEDLEGTEQGKEDSCNFLCIGATDCCILWFQLV